MPENRPDSSEQSQRGEKSPFSSGQSVSPSVQANERASDTNDRTAGRQSNEYPAATRRGFLRHAEIWLPICFSAVVKLEAGHTQLFPGTFHTQVAIPLKDFTAQDATLILNEKETIDFHLKVEYGDGFGNAEQSVFSYNLYSSA